MTDQLHRRATLWGFASAGLAGLIAPALATETTQYWYDSLGRVIRVQFQDGSTVVYSYDAAGNRTAVARTSSPPSTTFTATIPITGSGPANLLSLANAAGYDGSKDANVTFTLASGVTITGTSGGSGNPGGPGIDVGNWPITQFYIVLALQISGTVYGGGGGGGDGNWGDSGTAGGDAIYCRTPMGITVNSGGILKAGGGGGGDGAQSPPPASKYGGGGGGGGAPNGSGGAGGLGNLINGHPGSSGTTSGGGAGGAPGGAGATVGGAGGTFATAGNNGGGGFGGNAGFAIRKNSFAVSVTNNGTIVGTVG